MIWFHDSFLAMRLNFTAALIWLGGSGFVVSLAAGLGIFSGAAVYTAVYAKATSYLSNDPAACVNCHVMREAFNSWSRGPHHTVAVCNDCHLPHDFLGKWLAKAENGWNHSRAFTLNDFHEPIRVHKKNLDILDHNCRSCHAEIVHQMTSEVKLDDSITCIHCHSDVGHGQNR